MAKRTWVLDAAITALAATTATGAGIAAFGQAKEGSPWTPFNAVAHMLFGDKAAGVDGFAPKESLSGLGLHAGALTAWGALYQAAAGKVPFPQSLATGALASALIWAFDYKIVPERLRPGFEKRLGPESVLAVYTLLALSLGLSPLWKQKDDHAA